MVNESFVKKWLKGKDPLRERDFGGATDSGSAEAGAVRRSGRLWGSITMCIAADQREIRPEMLIPFWQIPWPQAAFGVRTAEDPLAMQRSIAKAVHSVDPEIALAQPETLDQIRAETMARREVHADFVWDICGGGAVSGGAGDLRGDGVQRGAAVA